MILKSDEKDTIIVRTETTIKRKRGKGDDGRVNIISEPEDKTQNLFLKAEAIKRLFFCSFWLDRGYVNPDRCHS